MKKIIRIVVAAILVAIFIWTLYFLYQKSEPKPVVYQTEQPFKSTIIKKTVATGAVVPRKEIAIKAKVSGIVETIYIEAGKFVKKGDPIAKVRIIPDMVSLNNAESRVNRAKISFENSNLEFNRSKTLYENKVIPESDFLTAQLNHKTAAEELEAAENNLQLIKEGSTKKMGNLSNTVVRSTIAGMVLDVPVKEGNSVIESNTFNEGTTIASVADMGEMIFEGKVDESEVGKIKTGMDLILHVGAIEGSEFKAKLEYIAPKGVEEEGAIQFQIKAAVEPDKDHFIRAGYSANADIVLDRRDSVLAIHESTMQTSGDTSFVEVEKSPGIYEKKVIKTGLSDGINIEILEGLKGDEKLKGTEISDKAQHAGE
ncbi:MAG TPA: efflux RND transporter periplasmic adaptor subunit [Bacteroidia bacterium]|nr:efflux RND transporter periplasmic adaptor subunit [Bacteroidia bacterium]